MTPSPDDEDQSDIAPSDVMTLGYKLAEMAARVGRMEKVLPGAIAGWHFEMEDVSYEVRVTVDRRGQNGR